MSDEASVRAFKKSAEEHGFHPESLEYRYMSVGWDEATRQAEARSQVQIVLLGDALRSYRTYHDAGQAKGDYDYPVCKCQQCQKAEKALAALRKEES